MATNPFGDAEVEEGLNPFGDMEVVNGPSPLEEGLGASPYEGLLGKLGQSFSAAPSAMKEGLIGLQLAAQDASAGTSLGATTDLNLQAGATPPTERLMRTSLVEKAQAQAAETKRLAPNTEGLDWFTEGLVNAPQSAGMTAIALPAAILTKSALPLGAVFGGQAAGSAYIETEDTKNTSGKVLTTAERLQHAVEQGTLEAGFEMLSGSVLLKALGGGKGVMPALKKFFIAELGTEEATTLTQNLSDWAHKNPEKTLGDWLAEQPHAMVSTLGGVVGQAGIQAGVVKGTTVAAEVVGKRLDAKFAAQAEELRKAEAAVNAALLGGGMDGISGQKPSNMPSDTPADTNPPQPGGDAVNDHLTPATAIPPDMPNPHTDIPTTPLTPEQLHIAQDQEIKLATGVSLLPENEEGVASLGNLNSALEQDAFKPVTEEEVLARAEELTLDQPHLADIEPSTGRSKADRIARNEFPNLLPMDEREIAWSSVGDEVGLNSRQVAPQVGGTVRLLGGHPDQFSPEYVAAIGETLTAWTRKYLPADAKVIVNLSGLSAGHVGAYQLLNNGTHVITPQAVTRAQDAAVNGVLTKFNLHAGSQTYGAITHEFGHALLMSQFVQGMPAEFRKLIDDLDDTSKGMFSSEQLAQMPDTHRAVVEDFQGRKSRVLTGEMSAKEMMRNWAGVWKIGSDLMKQKANLKSLDTMTREALADVNKEGGLKWSTWADGAAVKTSVFSGKTTALEMVHALGRNTSLTEAESNAAAEAYYLNFNEFMAEQFSRYAYSERIDEGTALGRYFAKALATLRRFFTEMQAEGFIKPGLPFKLWVDGVVEARALQTAKAPKKVRKARRKGKPQGAKEIVEAVVRGNLQEASPLRVLETDEAWVARAKVEMVELGLPPSARRVRADLQETLGLGSSKTVDRAEFARIIADWKRSQPKADVKGKGGNWFHTAIGVLATPLYTGVIPPQPEGQDFESPEWKAREAVTGPYWDWSRKIVTTYLNRYAGTKDDPLKDLQLPNGKTWGELMDESLASGERTNERGEALWDIPASPGAVRLRSYVEHAVDYLKANVPQDKWTSYDFIRLLSETAKDDLRVQRLAEKAALASLEGVPVHKTYEDGSRWLALPDTSTEAGMKVTKQLGELGGWCTQKDDAALRYGSAGNRLFTLVNAQGKPSVQIQVKDMGMPEVGFESKPAIMQLKGRFNEAVEADALLQARDFVTSGKWVSVRDLPNVGLLDAEHDQRIPSVLVDKVLAQLPGNSRYLTEGEAFAVLDPLLKELQPQVEAWAGKEIAAGRDNMFLRLVLRNFAAGTYTPEKYRTLMGQLLGYMQTDSVGLHFDNTGPEGQADRNNSNAAVSALKRIGQSITDYLPVAKAINFVSNQKYNVLQVQQLSATNNEPGLQAFVQFMTMLGALKNRLLKPGAELAKVWEHLPERTANAFESMLRDEELSGVHVTELQLLSGVWTHVSGPALRSFVKTHGLDPASEEGRQVGQLMLDYKNSILMHIAVRESEAIQLLRERYSRAPLVLQMKANEIRAAATKWRSTPYTPRGRFGNFIVKVFGRDPDTGRRELVHVEHFESEIDMMEAQKRFLGRFSAEDVKTQQISEAEGIQMSLPREFLETLRDTDEFSNEQLTKIGEAMTPISTDKVFKVFARDALKVSGAEPDLLRNYVNWIEDSANSTAKFVYGRQLAQAVALTRQAKRNADKAGLVKEARRLQHIADTMARAKGYVMHPLAEYHQVKNAVSLMYLLWAPKTAIMNLTGLLQTWAAVTAEFGDVKGNAAFGKAMKDLATGGLTEDDKWLLGKAENEGFVNQGFGYFMSGLANSGNLARRIRKNVAGRAQRAFMEGGMKAFTAVEMVNRKTTLLTMFRLELARSLAKLEEVGDDSAESKKEARDLAYAAAAKKTKLLQNDYAAGNRPAMFQGKQSLLMIFYSFTQYMLWIMTGGYERATRLEARARGETPRSLMGGMTMRMWILFAVLGGGEGVPFGKTLMMFIQWLSNKFWGGKNVEVEADRMVKEVMGIDSLYIRHALKQGLLHDLGGIDLSGSFSMGTPLPGTKFLASNPRTANEAIGGLAQELAGPFGGVVGGAFELGLGDGADVKTLGGAAPGMGGTVVRAYDAWTTGMTDRKGALVLRDEEGKARRISTGENVALALGFPLTEVSDKRNFEAHLRQQVHYWVDRRTGLLEDYAEAVQSKDRALVEDVVKAVKEFAGEAPKGLAITGKDLNSYVRAKQRGVLKAERDIVPEAQRSLERSLRQEASGG